MNQAQNIILPRFVIFEGVDGTGKTTLARTLATYYTTFAPRVPLYANSFPGSTPGTLGEWVYRLHHHQAMNAPDVNALAPAALQMLHVAAHIDAICNQIAPVLTNTGSVILDRYWWSTYSYSRMFLPAEQVWPLVNAERVFLETLPQPTIIYLTRNISLKTHELSSTIHMQLDRHYHEVLEQERQQNPQIYEINNDGPFDQTWRQLLMILGLPYSPL